MTKIRCTGRSAEAARVLIERSALGPLFDRIGHVGYGPGLTVVTAPDLPNTNISYGENLLLNALTALSGPGGRVDLWSCASSLDESNARALADAVSIALTPKETP